MYYYKLTLKNGIEYLIKDKENLLANENTYTYEIESKEINTNTIMILTSEIIAGEYYSIWG